MSYRAARLVPSQQEAVLGLWRDNLADLQADDSLDQRYRWLHAENPAGRVETVVAVHEPDGAVVGCASAFPRMITVDGCELKAGVPVDFAVARTHRTAGAALSIQRALLAEASGFSFFCGFPNKSALPVLQRVGFKPFATAGAWVKPLTANYKIAGYVAGRLPIAVASAAPNLWLRGADRWRVRGRARVTGEFLDRADGRFDALWEAARHNHSVTGVRTSAYLNWRYAGFRARKYAFFCVSGRDATDLIGYVAFTRRDNKVYVGDLFATDMGDAAASVLLEFSRQLRRQRVDSIFLGYAGNVDFEALLQAQGFIRRPRIEGRSMVAHTGSTTPEQSRRLLDKSQWHLFDGEMDI